MIRWKWPTTNAVSCKGMSRVGCARNGPLRPPETNSDTKPMANSIGVYRRMFPRHNVPSQLKVLIAEGTPMHMVRMENAKADHGLMPLMNMWCPHTMKPRKPMASIAYTIALYPKMGLREKVESSWEATPMPGRIAM